MSASDRYTPKEIKAWCKKTLCNHPRYFYGLSNDDILKIMYKTYKRGYQDALGG